MFLRAGIPLTDQPTLIFLDEIQESPEAVGQLRYFHEEYPQLYVIAAGSLLEFTLKRIASFPVGRVEQVRYCTLSILMSFCWHWTVRMCSMSLTIFLLTVMLMIPS